MFELVRPHDDIQHIYYFTAKVNGPSGSDQETYLNALGTLPKISIIEGKFKNKNVVCRVSACALKRQIFQQPEEKRTDVNIALQMLDDAYQGTADRMLLVSGDSDLVPAVNFVRHRAPNCEIVVYIPSSHPKRGAAVELRTAAHKHRSLPLAELAKAQFPRIVTGPSGATYERPTNW